MAMVLMLVRERVSLEIDPSVGERLEALGVTSVTVLQGAAGTAYVLEGWAFDARSSQDAARACLVGNNESRVTVLQQRLHVSLGMGAGGGLR